MSTDYDALYAATPNALGAPTPDLMRFFARFAGRRLDILDIGCGQGRDALPLARAGHTVTGVDLSPNGIAALTEDAKAEGLDITGIVADLTAYTPGRSYDLILADRTLHMLAPGDRLSLTARLLDHVRPGGWIAIADEWRNIPALLDVIDEHPAHWTPERPRPAILLAQRDGPADP